MRRLSALCLAFALAGFALAGSAAGAYAQSASADELLRLERAWLDAYVTDDREAMAGFLDDAFTITFPGGRIDTKADVIAGLDADGPHPPGEGPHHYTEGTAVRFYGEPAHTAILTGVYVSPRSDGSEARFNYTDTWVLEDGRWRVAASHLTRMPPE
ncbi:MAG: nuclear transport factor 2 family protein [Rhodothermales bacterium]|nr:nuclear transport factor 2 family protein [Rhodothermales bacterium]